MHPQAVRLARPPSEPEGLPNVTTRIATLAGCIALFILALTIVVPRFADDRSADGEPAALAQALATATSGHEHGASHAEHAAQLDVAGLLETDTQSLRFCASSSLQPYEGALQQIEDLGGGEAATRFARCLLETMLYHAPASSAAELDTHHGHFAGCFAALAEQRFPDPSQAADAAAECVATDQQ